jgi:glyoxylase-like metal-dependent hydrolase (beta-lactamase superfamily II)
MSMEHYLCVTCGTQYPASERPPGACAICQDDRQYVNPNGQQWTTLAMAAGHHANAFQELAPGITAIATEPKLGIGQRAHLLHIAAGLILWDLVAYLDAATIAEVRQRGQVVAIAISHPHFFTTMVEWSRALGDVPIHLHEANRRWVMRPDPAIRYFDGESLELAPRVRVLRCGGHFPGSSVLHWADARDADGGAGALFTGDTIKVAADRRYVTFMYSYPNSIPLDAATVRHIAETVRPLPFTALYDGWDQVAGDGHEAVARSAERYIAHLTGQAAP